MAATALVAPLSVYAKGKQQQPAIYGQVTAAGKPVAGVSVSDGVSIVKTDANGNYAIQNSDKADGTVFITTPSGYMALSNDGFQPGFWRTLNAPAGTPEVHNFELTPQNQDVYSVLYLPDLHLTNEDEKRDLQAFETLAYPVIQSLYEQYSQDGPVYCFNLGDISHDIYWYDYGFTLDKVINYLKGKAWPFMTYSVSGNHDNDPSVIGDNVNDRAAWLYRKILGPAQYSVNIGNDHWIFLDNIEYINEPGKGKKAKGVNGDRSYNTTFTPAQLAWVAKDLENVEPGQQVRVVCHSPLLLETKKTGLVFKKEDMDKFDQIFSKFEYVPIYSGHAHSLTYCKHEDYPRFFQHIGPAASGNMWTTSRYDQTLSTDGTEAGVFVGKFVKNQPEDRQLYTYAQGKSAMRTYDLNAVGDYYRNDSIVRKELSMYPKRTDFSDPKFENGILINYWRYEPGEVVEFIENGKPLNVTYAAEVEDPLWNVIYYAPLSVELGEYKSGYNQRPSAHLFMAKAKTSDSPIEIRVKDANGKVVRSEVMQRPKKFDKGAK